MQRYDTPGGNNRPRPCTTRPRVGISRCLLGDEVRYDGTHKRQTALLNDLSGQVEWIPVCPEVEVGMGTPREPIQLVGLAAVKLVGVDSGRDWTDAMSAWAQLRVRALQELDLSGFILKARSPSCGVRDVPIAGAPSGRGIFAAALLDAFPDLPIADEDDLHTDPARSDFLARVRRHRQSLPLSSRSTSD